MSDHEGKTMNKKAILFGVKTPDAVDFDNSISETAELMKACGLDVMQIITQSYSSTRTPHYIGQGKITELITACEAQEAVVAVAAHELTGSQMRNLQELIPVEIIDRTQLILTIFAERAQTSEAKIQVEMANLQYQLPRINSTKLSQERQQGGGVRNRGTGETRTEIDKRRLESKLQELHELLDAMEIQRSTQRKRRKKQQLQTVAIVGYTNSGKSTLLNAMLTQYQGQTDKSVLEKDMLFATLQTSARRITLPNRRDIILTDTVGFVSSLPHTLIKAFRSTLEEVKEADLLLHVVDYSNPNHENQAKVTLDTLKEIGAADIPLLTIFNKIDKVDGQIPESTDNTVFISAVNRLNLDLLAQKIIENLGSQLETITFFITYQHEAIRAEIMNKLEVLKSESNDEGTLLTVRASKQQLDQYSAYIFDEK